VVVDAGEEAVPDGDGVVVEVADEEGATVVVAPPPAAAPADG
jgi:hypothetical protein